jgi:hypothetical protein
MSKFEDPAYMAESKADLVIYMNTGHMPASWFDAHSKRINRGPRYRTKKIIWTDWELRTVVSAIRKGGRYFTNYLPPEFRRPPKNVRRKLALEGGRESFLAKYGEL